MTELEDTVSKLTAARDHLKELREASTGTHWIVIADQEGSNICPKNEGGVILWGEYADSRDTELVVTLHRTIDAQIALLEVAIRFSEFEGFPEIEALAEAILGW